MSEGHDSVAYLRGEVNRLNNVIADRDWQIQELKRENADLKARLIEWEAILEPSPEPAIVVYDKPKPQGEDNS